MNKNVRRPPSLPGVRLLWKEKGGASIPLPIHAFPASSSGSSRSSRFGQQPPHGLRVGSPAGRPHDLADQKIQGVFLSPAVIPDGRPVLAQRLFHRLCEAGLLPQEEVPLPREDKRVPVLEYRLPQEPLRILTGEFFLPRQRNQLPKPAAGRRGALQSKPSL